MDVPGARYADVENVDLEQTVSKFITRWIAQAKLDVDPSLVTLRLVKSSEAEPKPKEEAIAKELRPRLTLAAAGITNSCSLLAFMAGVSAFTRSFSTLCPTVFPSQVLPLQ
jgi:hypothetical protein